MGKRRKDKWAWLHGKAFTRGTAQENAEARVVVLVQQFIYDYDAEDKFFGLLAAYKRAIVAAERKRVREAVK